VAPTYAHRIPGRLLRRGERRWTPQRRQELGCRFARPAAADEAFGAHGPGVGSRGAPALRSTVGSRVVTVDEIAFTAHISARTFYRYFPNKEDVLQVQIDRRSTRLRAALSARPGGRGGLPGVTAFGARGPARDGRHGAAAALDRRHRGQPISAELVLGGIQLKIQRVIAEFFGARLRSAERRSCSHDDGRGVDWHHPVRATSTGTSTAVT